MGYHKLELEQFILRKEDGELKEDLVSLFDIDSDYNGDNGDEHYREDTLALGYKTEAHRIVDETFSDEFDDTTNITNLLDYINEYCHGSYSINFTYNIVEVEDCYVVAVAYMR